MLKTGFRGERKGILTPALSQGEGECSDGKRGNVVTEKRLKDSFLTCWTYGRSGTRAMTLLMYIKCI